MRVASILALGFATLTVLGACGSGHPRAEENSTPPTALPGGPKPLFNVDGGSAPPGCGTKDDGTACECIDAPLYVDPPTIYFVLDRSGSMAIGDKWTQVRMTVANVMRSLGPRANFGATAFPGSAGGQCGAGEEVLPVTPGDPPSSGADGPAVLKLIAATAYQPGGGTPTGATLVQVNQRLAGTGRTYVIVATDGAPNCNPTATCSSAECQPNIEHFKGENIDCVPNGDLNCCLGFTDGAANCNDRNATISAIQALKGRGIPVYVIGLPGTQFPAYVALLNEMALAGGTAQATEPRYFAVQGGSSAEILVALKKIAAQIAGTCEFDLKEPPADAKLVNVYIDDVVLPQEPVNGWSIAGKTVTLLGDACNRVKTGDVLSVRIIAGCPTVYPK